MSKVIPVTIALLNAFWAGCFITTMFLIPPPKTWEEVAAELPYITKRNITIDFCAEHRRMCRAI